MPQNPSENNISTESMRNPPQDNDRPGKYSDHTDVKSTTHTNTNDQHTSNFEPSEIIAKAKLTVGPAGGMFKIAQMGVQLYFPTDAVDTEQALTVTLFNDFRDSPEEFKMKPVISARISIEPTDIKYQKAVYLIMEHSLPQTDGVGTPILLHSISQEKGWEVIPNNKDDQKDLSVRFSTDKRAYITPTETIISMMTNCRFFEIARPDLGITLRVMKLCVMVFADYQPQGRNLNIRVYAAHDLAHRRSAVNHHEQSNCGRFIGSNVLLIGPEHNDLLIDVSVNDGGTESERISYNSVRVELDASQDTVPSANFVVTRSIQAGDHGPPKAAKIKVTAKHAGEQTTIVQQTDLDRLREGAGGQPGFPYPVEEQNASNSGYAEAVVEALPLDHQEVDRTVRAIQALEVREADRSLDNGSTDE